MIKIKSFKSNSKRFSFTIFKKHSPDISVDEQALEVVPENAEPVLHQTVVNYINKVEVSGNNIRYSLICEQDSYPIYDVTVSLDDIKSNLNFADQTLWGVSDTFSQQNETRVDKSQTQVVPASEIQNIFAKTLSDKSKAIFSPIIGISIPFGIFVPSIDSTIDDCVVILSEFPDNSVEDGVTLTNTNDTPVAVINVPNDQFYADLIAGITVTASPASPAAGDDITLSVTCSDPTVKYVYVEPRSGIVNKTKIAMNEGVGSVIVKTGDLVSGDEVEIKLGYKFYTGVYKYLVTLA
jgi:hypothetical protein